MYGAYFFRVWERPDRPGRVIGEEARDKGQARLWLQIRYPDAVIGEALPTDTTGTKLRPLDE